MGWHVPIAVGEFMDRSETVTCASCEAEIEEAYFDDHDYYCEACMKEVVAEMKAEAKAYALENCKITRPLPKYDPARYHACTRDEYEFGSRESYTPSAFVCHCRHNCTNYDDLIRSLYRYEEEDGISYDAIRERIDELLVEQGIEWCRLEQIQSLADAERYVADSEP